MKSAHYEERLSTLKNEKVIHLDETHRDSVLDLNLIQCDILDLCQTLENPFDIESILYFYVTENNYRFLKQFTDNVVLKKSDHKKWKKGRILYPDLSLQDLLTQELPAIYEKVETQYNFISKPEMISWNSYSKTTGCFVIVDKESTYKSQKINGFLSQTLDDTKLLKVKPEKRHIWFRRWIASRLAMFAKSNATSSLKLDDVLKSKNIPINNEWSEDALIAYRAIRIESEIYPSEKAKVPGYIGEDDLYKR